MFPQISRKVAIFYFKVEGATRPLKVKELKVLVVTYIRYLFYYFSDLHDTNNFVWMLYFWNFVWTFTCCLIIMCF